MAQAMAAWYGWLRRKELVAASPRSPSYASSSSDESLPPQRVWADVRRRSLTILKHVEHFMIFMWFQEVKINLNMFGFGQLSCVQHGLVFWMRHCQRASMCFVSLANSTSKIMLQVH